MSTFNHGPALAAVVVMSAAATISCVAVDDESAAIGYARGQWRSEAAAGPGSGEVLPELKAGAGLPDYLAYAAINNPGLEAAFHRWKAALERVPQARAFPDPRLTFGWFIQEVETKVGPQRAKVGISQMFPWRGKRGLRGEIALHAAEAAHAKYETAKLKLFHRVKRAYWEYWYLARAIAVTQQNLELLGQLEGVARRKYAAGTTESSALTKVQVELGKLEERLAELRDLRVPTSARLNAALGRYSTEPLPWPSGPPKAEETKPDLAFDALMEVLKSQSPELAGARLETLRTETAVTLARRNRRPDFAVGLDYVFTGEATGPVEDSGKDPVVLGFSMGVPLARTKYRAAEREAEAMRLAAERSLDDRTNELASALQLTLFKYRDAARKIGLYRDALVPKARQAVHVARRAFEADRVSFLDLIDAQRTLLKFELSEKRALADRAISLSELNALVGSDVLGAMRKGRDSAERPAGAGVGE